MTIKLDPRFSKFMEGYCKQNHDDPKLLVQHLISRFYYNEKEKFPERLEGVTPLYKE